MHGEQVAKVIACVNHDANAIASHAANHPDALHFVEDIRTLNLDRLLAHVEVSRKQYPAARVVLWASLECTNFSIAKGGQSRDADSRTLAEHLFRYIDALRPDYIQIENVKEFMTWGPLAVKVVDDFADRERFVVARDDDGDGFRIHLMLLIHSILESIAVWAWHPKMWVSSPVLLRESFAWPSGLYCSFVNDYV